METEDECPAPQYLDEIASISSGSDEIRAAQGKKRKHDATARTPKPDMQSQIGNIRKIFKTQHSHHHSSEEPIQCVRVEGQWRVSEDDRLKFKISGYQGTKNATQSFFVRIRNQVISKKFLDSDPSDSETVEATFEDPRDASDVHHQLTALFRDTLPNE